VFTCEILNAPETDHSVITLYPKSESARQPRGPGFWKLYNSLLEEHEYSNRLRESVTLFKNKYADVEDLGMKWDLLKMEIRGFTIKYSKIKAKKKGNPKRLYSRIKLTSYCKNLQRIPAINNS